MQVRETAFDSDGIISFLDVLQQQIAGNIVVVWDGGRVHRSKKIKEYLAEGASKRVFLERLPGYAPDLNSDEGIWHYLKHVLMKNLCCPERAHLTQERTVAAGRLRERPPSIHACFEQTDYFRTL